MLKGFTRNFHSLEILTDEQVEAIHRGTLAILENTGLRFESDRALKLFKKNDCMVDIENKRVRFPSALVEDCLRRAPSSFHIRARDYKNDLIIGGNTVYFMSSCGMDAINQDTWEPRIATLNENYAGVKIMDALENLHFLTTYSPYFRFEGVPQVMSMLESCTAKFRNASKVQWEGYSQDCEKFTIEMAKAIGTDLIVSCYPASPLTVNGDAVEAAFRAIEAGLPIGIGSGPVMGGTAPATIAGAIISNNAELIGGVVLAQLIKSGAKIIVGDFTFVQNMTSGAPDFGQIGESLHKTIFSQIWRKYEIPTTTGASPGFSSSKRIDFQCGYERAILSLTSALSGFNLIGLHGGIHGELSWSPLQAILDDDIAGMIGRYLEGVCVNYESLSLDLIDAVGPIPGHYLNKQHTRKWWKKEQFIPKVADRRTYPEWLHSGKKGCIDNARERMVEILNTHTPKPLSNSQENEIERILREARLFYKKKGLISDDEWKIYMKNLASTNYSYAQ